MGPRCAFRFCRRNAMTFRLCAASPDLATNKASAAPTGVNREIVDLVTIHETFCRPGPVLRYPVLVISTIFPHNAQRMSRLCDTDKRPDQLVLAAFALIAGTFCLATSGRLSPHQAAIKRDQTYQAAVSEYRRSSVRGRNVQRLKTTFAGGRFRSDSSAA